MSKIFISYRRADSAGFTGHLRSRLDAYYGKTAVFEDITDIPYGAEFDKAIEASLGAAVVQLVVIGRDWLNAKDAAGNRRLDATGDYVAREIEIGLTRGLRMIPVLVDDPALMPRADDLPERIRKLAVLNAPTIREARFDADIDALIKQIGPLGSRVLGVPKRTALMAVVVAATLAVAGAVVSRPGPAERMGAVAFNVAVARFVELVNDQPVKSHVTSDLSDTVAKDIETKITDVEVWGPSKTGTVHGATDDDRAKNAMALAQRINADVALYGVVVSRNGRSYLRTGYVLAGKSLGAAGADLVGPYRLDDSEEFRAASDKGALQDLGRVLANQSSSLAGLVAGLDSYANGRFVEAKGRFAALDKAWTTKDDSGHKALFLYMGLTAARLKDFSGAQMQYRRALDLDPSFGRAQLGLAEAEFQTAKGDCRNPATMDDGAIEAASALFAQAGSLPDPKELGNLAIKAAFGRGRIQLCRAFAGLTDAETARREYSKVIDDFAARDETSKEAIASVAAAAHADLGALNAYIDEDLGGGAKEFRAAVSISDTYFDSNFGVYAGNLGCVLLRLGETTEAEKAYKDAIDFTKRNRSKNPSVADLLLARLSKELVAKSCG